MRNDTVVTLKKPETITNDLLPRAFMSGNKALGVPGFIEQYVSILLHGKRLRFIME